MSPGRGIAITMVALAAAAVAQPVSTQAAEDEVRLVFRDGGAHTLRSPAKFALHPPWFLPLISDGLGLLGQSADQFAHANRHLDL